MAVKIASLWKNSSFNRLSDKTKLLYLYLITNRDISIVGTLSPNLEVVCLELGCTMEQLRESTKCLMDNKFIRVKNINGTVYFIIPKHFSTIPKSQSSVLKVQKILKELPEELVIFLESLGISSKQKIRVTTKPTAGEATKHALSLGYLIDGNEFVRYYEDMSDKFGKTNIWVDGRGTEVRDWKAKMKRVWCKDEHKLKTFDNAPKGFESFYIVQGGKAICPDGWRNGKPFSKEFTVDIELKKQFNNK